MVVFYREGRKKRISPRKQVSVIPWLLRGKMF
jgi:hypothetical protein